MPGLFYVIRSRGENWNPRIPMEQQQDWARHAEFMNGLTANGSIVLGGPLVGTSDILLIMQAKSDVEIKSLLAGDCWSRSGLLAVSRIAAWEIRLGYLEQMID